MTAHPAHTVFISCATQVTGRRGAAPEPPPAEVRGSLSGGARARGPAMVCRRGTRGSVEHRMPAPACRGDAPPSEGVVDLATPLRGRRIKMEPWRVPALRGTAGGSKTATPESTRGPYSEWESLQFRESTRNRAWSQPGKIESAVFAVLRADTHQKQEQDGSAHSGGIPKARDTVRRGSGIEMAGKTPTLGDSRNR